MKIFLAPQIRALDQYTIQREPIVSIDLMERAAQVFTHWFIERYPDVKRPIHIFCGPGNNGGDGLAVARLLHQRFYDVSVYLCQISPQTSADFRINRERLPAFDAVSVKEIAAGDVLPALPRRAIAIDAIFGSGLSRPVEGYWGKLLEWLNVQPVARVAIDIPSGLLADAPSTGVVFHADYTLSFEVPKLAFFFPENAEAVGQWAVRSIGLHPEALAATPTDYHYLDEAMAAPLIKTRTKYGHKGTYGHALLIMGSYGKMGAAILASRACLRAGAGLVTAHIPRCGYEIMQISVPEAMVSIDRHQYYLSELPPLEPYTAIAAGCGLDGKKTTRETLLELLQKAARPLVLDADALNILGKNQEWQRLIPAGSILTPHPREFERLFGKTVNSFERNALQRAKAQELGVYILLKGAHTCIATPQGDCYFNATGNPGMATGGSGDVLTGIIAGLLAQGYAPLEAALLGAFVHGLAGDIAAAALEHESLIAGDIVQYLGGAFQKLHHTLAP
jgi:ADP-dependent NAD(P)H-hydrate dehydratase / NAD(P)H-hydrate epimerase